MLAELITGVFLLVKSSFAELYLLNMVLLGSTWLVTFFFSARYHNQLLAGYDGELVNKLVNTNWIRTGLWSVRVVLLSLLFIEGTGL